MTKCGLQNILKTINDNITVQNTHLHRFPQIDFVLAADGLAPFIDVISMVDVYLVFKTVHRTFFIYIDVDGFFGSRMHDYCLWNLQLEEPFIATEYRSIINCQFEHHNLYRRIKSLSEASKSSTWNLLQETQYGGMSRDIT
jgi:hypothetical protein